MSTSGFDRLSLTTEQKEILKKKFEDIGNIKHVYKKLSQDITLKNAGIVGNSHQLRYAVQAIQKPKEDKRSQPCTCFYKHVLYYQFLQIFFLEFLFAE